MSATRFVTETGCRVEVMATPDLYFTERDRDGSVYLLLRMDGPGDSRSAEVRLSNEERNQLILALVDAVQS